MTPRKFKIAVANFPYGGNSGISNEHPAVGKFIGRLHLEARDDPRIESVGDKPFNDTPITMTRNDCIQLAREQGIDVLVMIDSDMVPDCEPDGMAFWKSSFDFFCKHYDKGPCVVCAPYCGPPPNECVYVFRWVNSQSHCLDHAWKLEMFPRDYAASLTGISEVGALPTGLILFDVRAFDLTAPEPCNDSQILADFKAGKIAEWKALKLLKQHSWCYYEYTDAYQRKKASTEDVTLTRDISLAGIQHLGYNPLYCNWDAWAGHVKPKTVRKPSVLKVEDVSDKMRDALIGGIGRNRVQELVNFEASNLGANGCHK